MESDTITVYGADWCGDCRRARSFLVSHQIPFIWVDTDQDKEGERCVKEVNRGMRSIPTIPSPPARGVRARAW